jgi:integrase
LNKSRSKKDRPAIYLRLRIGEKRAELSTYQHFSPSQWNQAAQCVKGNSEESQNINRNLAVLKANLHRHYSLLVAAGKPFTVEDLKNAALGKVEHSRTLAEAFDFHNRRFAEKVKSGKTSARTLKRLEITKNKVMSFLKLYFKFSDLPLIEVKHAFAADFEHYMATEQHIGSNTAMRYVKILKQVLKMTVDQGWLPANIVTGIDGEKWLAKNRTKTDTPEHTPLLPIAAEIIDRYKDNLYCKHYDRLLPVNSNQRYNAYLQEIATICGIKKHLTTHTARHTFATTVTLENDVPIETVSQLLGHKSIRTTQIYAKITQRKVSNNMRALKNKLFAMEGSLCQSGKS